jgi:hypothetical protein
MAGLLSAVGIGAKVPDPTAFTAQQEVNSQISQVTSGLTGTVGQAQAAAALAGVNADPSYLAKIKEIEKDAQAAAGSATSTESPADLEKKRQELNARLKSAKKENAIAQYTKNLAILTDMKGAVEKENASVQQGAVYSEGLKKRYAELLTEVDRSLNDLRQNNPALKEGFQEAAPPPPPPPPPQPIPKSVEELLDIRRALCSDKTAEERNDKSIWRLLGKSAKMAIKGVWWGSLALGILLGGVTMMNLYYKEPSTLVQWYYLLYGAIFFPISLLMGVFYFRPFKEAPYDFMSWIPPVEPRMGGSDAESPEDTEEESISKRFKPKLLLWLGDLITLLAFAGTTPFVFSALFSDKVAIVPC